MINSNNSNNNNNSNNSNNWRPAGAATNPVKRWPDSEQSYPGNYFFVRLSAHCAYRRV